MPSVPRAQGAQRTRRLAGKRARHGRPCVAPGKAPGLRMRHGNASSDELIDDGFEEFLPAGLEPLDLGEREGVLFAILE